MFALVDGKHVTFNFKKDLRVQAFNSTWRGYRVGRLLPPFLTRLLERYAAYSHRPGIPRVPSALVQTVPRSEDDRGVIGELANTPAASGPGPEHNVPQGDDIPKV